MRNDLAPQLSLDFGCRPALGLQDFLVADCNREAVAWLDLWPDWRHPALAVYGPPGCGKTHLAHVFAAFTKAPILKASSLVDTDPFAVLGEARAVIIEDGEGLIDQIALFHLYNAVKEEGRFLLLTGRMPPARWPVSLADLSSRLSSIPAVAIQRPDDGLMAALVVKLFADRQLKISQDALSYLLARMERSFDAAREIVERADRVSLSTHRPIAIPLIRDVLETMQPCP